jgi:regulator of nucleoside diphosphate kinase
MLGQTDIIVSSTDMSRLQALLKALPPAARREIGSLLKGLDRADVRAPGQVPRNVVTMNSTVRFTLDERELCLTLVYPFDINGRNRISVFAPVGSALLGLSEGARVPCQRPGAGVDEICVLEVIAHAEQPQATGAAG